MKKLLTYLGFTILLLFSANLKAEEMLYEIPDDAMLIIVEDGMPRDTVRFGHYNIIMKGTDKAKVKKRSRWIAAGADILTGPLGGHRIYMGTEPWVPVVYAVTLGGGMGFLPVVDLFIIVFTKDFDRWCDNPQVIMWL